MLHSPPSLWLLGQLQHGKIHTSAVCAMQPGHSQGPAAAAMTSITALHLQA